MKYRFRIFEDRNQWMSSIGWVMVLFGIFFCFRVVPPGLLIIAAGTLLILVQRRGRTATVDIEAKLLTKGLRKVELTDVERIFLKQNSFSQTVNSRVSSTSQFHVFLQGFVVIGTEKILLSSNKDNRDVSELEKLAAQLQVPFEDLRP